MPNQPIKFLFHQLATNEQDRERFNSIDPDFFYIIEEEREIYFEVNGRPFDSNTLTSNEVINSHILCEKFTRTCLSRVNNEAVLGVFNYDGTRKINNIESSSIILLYNIRNSFNYPLDNGHQLSEAIEALHDKMLELVPEYKEFCKNNK